MDTEKYVGAIHELPRCENKPLESGLTRLTRLTRLKHVGANLRVRPDVRIKNRNKE